jgi:putative hydroxymethylpyrimidine transport system substrate-binding protein
METKVASVKRKHLTAVVLTMSIVTSACGGDAGTSENGPAGQQQEGAERNVRVLMDWFPNPDHIGLYTAQRQGEFGRSGLNVTLTPPSNAADPLKLVASGRVDLGISYEPDVILAAQQRVPVTAVGALIPVPLNSFMAIAGSPVKSPADLAGRTVGVPGVPSDDLYLQQFATKYGIDLKSVKKVNVNTSLVSAMLSRKVDATIGAYRNIEGVQLAAEGKNPVIMPVTAAGVPTYNELVIVANRQKLAQDAGYQDTVRRFLAAVAKGTDIARRQPAVANASIAPVAKGYSRELIRRMVDATAPLLANPQGFGRMDPAQWQRFADWLFQQRATRAKVDTGPLVSNNYLPAS